MSDRAPEGNKIKKAGNDVAVCNMATITGESVSVVISQPAPASCIQVPILETRVASHNQRKVLMRSGVHGEVEAVICDISGFALRQCCC